MNALTSIIRIKFSSKDLFESCMTSFRPEQETCPICDSFGNCHVHAYYGRRIIDFIKGRPVRMDITILRLVCESCGHTHAVLPDPIIPYLSYSLFFILRVLAEAFAGFLTHEQLCERFGIKASQLYKWISLFKLDKQEWLGLLACAETSEHAFLRRLCSLDPFSDFAQGFILKCIAPWAHLMSCGAEGMSFFVKSDVLWCIFGCFGSAVDINQRIDVPAFQQLIGRDVVVCGIKADVFWSKSATVAPEVINGEEEILAVMPFGIGKFNKSGRSILRVLFRQQSM